MKKVKNLVAYVFLFVVFNGILIVDSVRDSLIYDMYGIGAYPRLFRESVGIIKCPKLFRDNSCAGEWHTLGTRDNPEHKK